MCEDTADPQLDNFWPFTDEKNCGSGAGQAACGTQAFRVDDYIAAPRDGIPTSADDAATTPSPTPRTPPNPTRPRIAAMACTRATTLRSLPAHGAQYGPLYGGSIHAPHRPQGHSPESQREPARFGVPRGAGLLSVVGTESVDRYRSADQRRSGRQLHEPQRHQVLDAMQVLPRELL